MGNLPEQGIQVSQYIAFKSIQLSGWKWLVKFYLLWEILYALFLLLFPKATLELDHILNNYSTGLIPIHAKILFQLENKSLPWKMSLLLHLQLLHTLF